MTDYLQVLSDIPLQFYSVQQTYQKQYEHVENDTFNTYFSINNYTKLKQGTSEPKPNSVDHLLVLDPQFFDTKIGRTKDMVKYIKDIKQAYIENTQNRLAVVSLSSNSDDFEDCFNRDPENEFQRYQSESEDVEYAHLNSFSVFLDSLTNIIKTSSSKQKENTILSIILISSHSFKSSSISQDQIKATIQEKLSSQNNASEWNKILVNCISLDDESNFFLSTISDQIPQSMFFFTPSKDQFLQRIQFLIESVSNIYVSEIQSEITFSNNTPYTRIEVIEHPVHWQKINKNTYRFRCPFFYNKQEISHMFKLNVTLTGSLREEQLKEEIGSNRFSFTFNGESYYFDKKVEICLVKELKEETSQSEMLNLKCEQNFVKDKYIVPVLEMIIDQSEEKRGVILTNIKKSLDQLELNSKINLNFCKEKLMKINDYLASQSNQYNPRQASIMALEANFLLKHQLPMTMM